MQNYCCFSCSHIHLTGKTSSFEGKFGCTCLNCVFSCNITFSVFWLSIRNGNENMAHVSLSLSVTFPFYSSSTRRVIPLHPFECFQGMLCWSVCMLICRVTPENGTYEGSNKKINTSILQLMPSQTLSHIRLIPWAEVTFLNLQLLECVITRKHSVNILLLCNTTEKKHW